MSTLATPASPRGLPRQTVRRPVRRIGAATVLFLGLHVPLALLMGQNPAISTVHALLVFAIGLFWATSGRPDRVMYVAAYIAGAEVLWRMTEAETNWEFGKYATAFILLVSLFRMRRLKAPQTILLYFLLLLPSAALTLVHLSLGDARRQISFNLSGPFALMLSVWFFSYCRISSNQLARVFTAVIAPITGVVALATYSTLTATRLVFRTSSLNETSGGFGANQVSAMFGLGALLALLLVLGNAAKFSLRAMMFIIVLWLLVQSALTFSRTGIALWAGSAFPAVLYLARNRDVRLTLGLVGGLLLTLIYFLLIPRLQDFTDGAFGRRFTNPNLTQRDELVKADLRIWEAHPILGVGPGRAVWERALYVRAASAHTEFSRMLAEHGTLGFASLCLLLLTAVRRVKAASRPKGKAVVIAMLAWCLLFMLVSAMRLVAPAFLFGLASANLLLGERKRSRFRRVEGRAGVSPRMGGAFPIPLAAGRQAPSSFAYPSREFVSGIEKSSIENG